LQGDKGISPISHKTTIIIILKQLDQLSAQPRRKKLFFLSVFVVKIVSVSSPIVRLFVRENLD